MITIAEHQKIEAEKLEGLDLTALRRCVNYDTSSFVTSAVNLIRYEFNGDQKDYRDGYYSYYRIGAEWIDKEQKRSVVVVPKIKNIDFIEMFMTCLQDNEAADNFSNIYDIDFDAKPIKSKALSSILSPLLVVQFLMVVKQIAIKGLRKGYISKTEVLPKVKGRINLRLTERYAITGHRERVHCTFDEYSIDNPENRLLKKALLISRNMISLMTDHKAYATLSAMCNHCLSVFEGVSDETSEKLPIVKSNKLYREYSEAIRIAKMILRRQDVSSNRNSNDSMNMVPVFRIDMALLFEHYSLSILRKTFGFSSIKYQTKGYYGRYFTDFLINSNNLRVIIDAKYVDAESGTVAKPEYIKQLSAYSRDKVILKSLGYDVTDEESIPIVPCVIAYPSINATQPSKDMLFSQPFKQTVKFYTYPINIPIIN